MYAITNGIGYYAVSLDTGRPTFLAKPFAYTYDTPEEAEAIAYNLRMYGLEARIVKY